jgi:hypothetical protein
LNGALTYKAKATQLAMVVDAKLKAGIGAAPKPKQQVEQAPKQPGDSSDSMLQKVQAQEGAAPAPATAPNGANPPPNGQAPAPAPDASKPDPKASPNPSATPAADTTSAPAPVAAGGVAKGG